MFGKWLQTAVMCGLYAGGLGVILGGVSAWLASVLSPHEVDSLTRQVATFYLAQALLLPLGLLAGMVMSGSREILAKPWLGCSALIAGSFLGLALGAFGFVVLSTNVLAALSGLNWTQINQSLQTHVLASLPLVAPITLIFGLVVGLLGSSFRKKLAQ